MVEKVLVSWKDMELYIENVVNWANSNNIKPTGVYGIPRGGLILATLLSYRMNIPLLLAPTQGCIIIDDIADSGRTLCHYTDNDTQFNKYHITTMYYHERSIVKPDYYYAYKDDKWIVFPWEFDEE